MGTIKNHQGSHYMLPSSCVLALCSTNESCNLSNLIQVILWLGQTGVNTPDTPEDQKLYAGLQKIHYLDINPKAHGF